MFARVQKLAAIVTFAAAAACSGAGGADGELDGAHSAPVTFSPHEVGLVLALVNDPATDLDLLDGDVGLERRAAENIVAHRNGPDGAYPSSDDDTFGDLEELDAVSYVGPTALAQLRDWAIAHLPAQAELVEGVQFTGAQATAVVWGVNQATLEELDVTVGLTRQAAENLVAGAPFATVTQMGAVSYVGPAALTALRDHASSWAVEMAAGEGPSQAGTYDGVTFDEPTATVALALANTATSTELTGGGMHSSGANAVIGGRPYTTLAHVAETYGVGKATMQALHDLAASQVPSGGALEGEECVAPSTCAAGLICIGWSIYPSGTCQPEWMGGTFESSPNLAIPDGDPSGIETDIDVGGPASVPEDVIVNLDIDHPRPQDLMVVLVGPTTSEEVLWSYGSSGEEKLSAGWGIERDGAVNGTWTLRIVDATGGEAGVLRGWSLELTRRWD